MNRYASTVCLTRYGTNPSDWEDWLELEAKECLLRMTRKAMARDVSRAISDIETAIESISLSLDATKNSNTKVGVHDSIKMRLNKLRKAIFK
jgi:hypothetical protein